MESSDEEDNAPRMRDMKRFNHDLEEFRDDVMKQIKRIKKENERINLDDAMDELDDLKKRLRNKDRFANKIKHEEIHNLLNGIKGITEDINKKILGEATNNTKNVSIIGNEFKGFKDNIVRKLDNLETNQKKHLVVINYLINHGNVKNKKGLMRIMADEPRTSSRTIQPNKRKPTMINKDEIDE